MQMRRVVEEGLSRWAVAAGLALLIVGAGAEARAQQPGGSEDDEPALEEADPAGEVDAEVDAKYDSLINQGTELYGAGEYDAAAAAFEQAYDLRPTPNLLYNIGRIYEKGGDFEEAVEYYDRFVNEPDIELAARQDALARLETLGKILERRRAKDQPDEPEEEPEPVEPVEPQPAPVEPEPEVSYALPITFLVAGGASLIGGGTFALLANQAATQRESTTDYEEFQRLNNVGPTRAILADSLLVTGGVLTALGVVFLLTTGPDEGSSRRALIAPSVGPDRVGAGVTMSF